MISFLWIIFFMCTGTTGAMHDVKIIISSDATSHDIRYHRNLQGKFTFTREATLRGCLLSVVMTLKNNKTGSEKQEEILVEIETFVNGKAKFRENVFSRGNDLYVKLEDMPIMRRVFQAACEAFIGGFNINNICRNVLTRRKLNISFNDIGYESDDAETCVKLNKK